MESNVQEMKNVHKVEDLSMVKLLSKDCEKFFSRHAQ